MFLSEISDDDAIAEYERRRNKQIKLRKLNPKPFDDTTTEMPLYDQMLANPKEMEQSYGFKFDIKQMRPSQYIQACVDGFNSSYARIKQRTDPDVVADYANKMLAGQTFPMPVLQYTQSGHFTQEGLHRAFAADKVGYDSIPVMVVEEIK